MTYTVDDHEKRFFIHQGPTVSSLEELFAELQTIEEWQFMHHVNDDKHDFANWVSDVFGDRFLAKKMQDAKTLDELQKQIFISLFR